MQSPMRRLGRALAVYAGTAAFLSAMAGAVVFEVFAARDVPECGLVESLQASVLLLASAAWFSEAAKGGRGIAGGDRALALVGFATFAMFVRELDRFFDVALQHGAWAAIDAAVLAAAAVVMAKNRRKTLDDVAAFATTPRALMTFLAVFSAVAFSQLLGWKGIWRSVFDNELWESVKGRILVYDQDVARHVKNVVEESVELFSYSMLLVVAVVPRLLAGGKGKD